MRARTTAHPTTVGSRPVTAVAVALAALMVLVVVGIRPARADGTPPFELPFACGETWWGATYGGHSRYYAIDFNTFNGDAWELGHPVLASAAGTVTASDYQASGAGNRVIIDHGGGWESVYYHLDSRAVGVGQAVARGHVIGGAGGTPSYPVHLHYEQRSGGSTVPATFGGVPFTYTEFDLPNGYQGLPVTSGNCGVVVTNPCGTFTDVDAASGFCADITWLVQSGITTGYADGTFGPGDPISRQ